MAKPKLVFSGLVAIDGIDCSDRLRPVSEKSVDSLVRSISELGVMQDAVHIRKTKSGDLVLLKGAHRIEAARRLGWDEVEAKIWGNVSDDWSRLMEIDDNLAGSELSALDLAVFMAERRRLYVKMHPETARGAAGARARWDATEPGSVAFTRTVAEARDITERQVRKIARAGAALDVKDVLLLRAAPKPVTLKDLTEIAKIGSVSERYFVCEALGEGRAKKASEARRQFAVQKGDQPPPKDPVDAAYLELRAKWRRAPKAAQRRFVRELADELSALLDEEGGDA